MLQELIHQIPTLISFIESEPGLPDQERKLYLSVIAHFEPVLQMAMPPRVDNRELRFLFFWPLHLQPEFFSFLRQKRPGALAILMYYATMLSASQSRYWFLEGWGERLMRACFEELEQNWQPAVQWPVSFINHNPTYDLFTNLAQMRRISSTTSRETSVGNLGYPQRRSVEIPYVHYATAPRPSYGDGPSSNKGPYIPHDAASDEPYDYKESAGAYAKQSGPAEGAD